MKNWKCAIGATLLTPIVLALIGLFSFGMAWVGSTFLTVGNIIGVICGGFVMVMIWLGLYLECIERREKSNK